jgi:hypothetical protein
MYESNAEVTEVHYGEIVVLVEKKDGNIGLGL